MSPCSAIVGGTIRVSKTCHPPRKDHRPACLGILYIGHHRLVVDLKQTISTLPRPIKQPQHQNVPETHLEIQQKSDCREKPESMEAYGRVL